MSSVAAFGSTDQSDQYRTTSAVDILLHTVERRSGASLEVRFHDEIVLVLAESLCKGFLVMFQLQQRDPVLPASQQNTASSALLCFWCDI